MLSSIRLRSSMGRSTLRSPWSPASERFRAGIFVRGFATSTKENSRNSGGSIWRYGGLALAVLGVSVAGVVVFLDDNVDIKGSVNEMRQKQIFGFSKSESGRLPTNRKSSGDQDETDKLKQEIESLALRWDLAMPRVEVFGKDEVALVAARVQEVMDIGKNIEAFKESNLPEEANESKESTEVETVVIDNQDAHSVEIVDADQEGNDDILDVIEGPHEEIQRRLENGDESDNEGTADKSHDECIAESEMHDSTGSLKILSEPIEADEGNDVSQIEQESKKSETKNLSVAQIREELESLLIQAQSIRSEVSEASSEGIGKLESGIRKDLEVVLAHDLANFDVEALRVRLVQLVLELKDRNRWEALRLYEMTKRNTEDLSEKYTQLLQEQKNRYEELIKEQVAAASTRVTEEVTRKTEEHFHRVLIGKEQQWTRDTKQRLDWQRKELIAEMENHLNAMKAEIESKAMQSAQARLAAVTHLKERVQEYREALTHQQRVEYEKEQNNSVLQALLDLQGSLYKDPSNLREKLENIRAAAAEDRSIVVVLNSLPSRVKRGEVESIQDLLMRFDTVYDNCTAAALVPENAGVLEHLFARAVSALKFGTATVSVHDGNDQQKHLSQARKFLHEEYDISSSIAEMLKLEGVVRQAANDWILSAQDFMAVEQAIEYIKLHSLSLNPVAIKKESEDKNIS